MYLAGGAEVVWPFLFIAQEDEGGVCCFPRKDVRHPMSSENRVSLEACVCRCGAIPERKAQGALSFLV